MQVGTKAGNDAHEGTQGGGSAQGQVGAAGGGLSLAELMESGLEEVRGMGNAGDDSKLSAPADAECVSFIGQAMHKLAAPCSLARSGHGGTVAERCALKGGSYLRVVALRICFVRSWGSL
eukprot:116222-Pelagomonas_calceolata.AAC.2